MADQLREELKEPNSLFRERYIDGVKGDPFNWEYKPGKGQSKHRLDIEDVFVFFASIWKAKVEETEGGNNRNRTDEEYDLD